jgi:cytochrome c peroxidase
MKIGKIAVLIAIGFMTATAKSQSMPNLLPLRNSSGWLETYNVNNAPISLTGAFFQSLGTNGRSCASCHVPPTDGRFLPLEYNFVFSSPKA